MASKKERSILLVSYYLPSRGHGGGLRLLDLYMMVRRLYANARLDLVSVVSGPDDLPEPEVEDIFDDIYLLKPDAFNPDGLRTAGLLPEKYEVVDLQYLQSGQLIRMFRNAGVRRVIFSPMESMVRALGSAFRGFSLTRSYLSRIRSSISSAARELGYVLAADHVLCVSSLDAKVLRFFRRSGGVSAIETGVSALEFPESLGASAPRRYLHVERRVVFVAYFGSMTNRDALNWYLTDVHPRVLEAVPGYRLQVVGRGAKLLEVQEDAVDIVGEVESIERSLEGAWVGIAPALSGAGLRGKINQYAITSVPCVASKLAADGLAYRDGVSIHLANDAKAFAKWCIRLLSYPAENREMGLAARAVCLASYAWEAKVDQVVGLYGELTGADAPGN
jgi:glycosyltransferase involved in cell wall biosynthesis